MLDKNFFFILLLIWGIPSTYFRSKFRKIVYKTDDWKINIKPVFIKEINGLISNIYPTEDDKWLVIAANLDPVFRRLAAAMEQPELAEDPRFSGHSARGKYSAELDSLIADWTKTHSAGALTELLDAHGVVVGPIYTIADIAKDPHYQARGMVRRFEDETFGDLAVPGFSPGFSESVPDIAWLGPQEVGAHNSEIYGDLLGLSADQLEELENEGII